MKEIIWVFGTSASGKETFIRTLLNDSELQETLGIAGQQITVSEESLKNLGKLDTSRASIIDEAFRLIGMYEVLLVKWQYGDTLLRTPDVLYSRYPAYKHIVIKLSVDIQEQKQRLQTKSWWHDKGHEGKFITDELTLVDDSIKGLVGKLAAVVSGGDIYTSTDSGASWTDQTSAGSRNWQSIASSADGSKLAAVVYGGDIYTAYNPALVSAPNTPSLGGSSGSSNVPSSTPQAPDTGYGAAAQLNPIFTAIVIGGIASVGTGLALLYRQRCTTS